MKILINPPLFINDKGKRDNNEDNIFPLPGTGTDADNLFIVCDGVGGADKGEVASRLACDSLADYFSQNEVGADEAAVLKAFDDTQHKFDAFFESEPFAKGMGTTVVLMQIHDHGITVAHCGDSRFYHFRKTRILWKSLDHTMVNELVRQGIISLEEAAARPKSNRISRAIQGYSVHKSKPDIQFIKEIKPGDIFFLCSDGVWEVFSDGDLTDIMSSDHSLDEKMEIIRTICEANSHDNYSAWLIEVRDVSAIDSGKDSLVKSTNFSKP